MSEQNNSASPDTTENQSQTPQDADNAATQTAPVAVQAPAGDSQTLSTINQATSLAFDVRTNGITVNGATKLEDVFIDIVDCKRSNKEHPRYPLNDIGISALFADAFRGELRYIPERDKWYRYDGKKWVKDNGTAMEYAKALVEELKFLADTLLTSDNVGESIRKVINKWQTHRARVTILQDAATIYPISMEEFDKNPFILNCLNGTLNMITGDFTPHNADDLLSKMANVVYDPAADCPRWRQHIFEVMQGDAEKATFLQQALGYALTGATNFECFFLLYGATSRNGKGVTMETFKTLMGDYGKSAKPETISQKDKANGSAASEDIARLAGARFINISEPDKKMVLSSALVKTLTGNDTITARYLYENSFEFKPGFKLFINTNHLPTITDSTVFKSGRIKIITFDRHFEDWEQDKGLKGTFAQPQNLSGILNWCLNGLWSLYNGGFIQSSAVTSAVSQYEQSSDKMACFIDDELEANPGSEVTTMSAYERYCQWCNSNGYKYGSQATFKKDMAPYAEIKRKRPAGQPNGNALWMILGYNFKTGA